MDTGIFMKYDTECPIRCFHCNDIFSIDQIQNHVEKCQLVNDEAKKNYGSYIAREPESSTQCNKTAIDKHSTNEEYKTCEHCHKSLNDIESELKILQLRIDDEKRNRLQFEYTWLTELSKFHERYQKSEDWRVNMFSVLSTLQKSIFNEEQTRLEEVNKMKDKFDDISSAIQNFDACVNEISNMVHEVKVNCLQTNEELIENFDDLKLQQDNRVASLNIFNNELHKLQVEQFTRSKSMLNLLDLNEKIIENQEACSKQVTDCGKDLKKFNELFNQENYVASSKRLEQLDNFKKQAESKLNDLLSWQKFVKRKLTNLEKSLQFDSADILVNEIQNSLIWYPCNDMPIYSTGHLLWCIFDFEEQLEESRLTNVLLHSPVFYTSEYGYKLQVRLYPNGLGQWKGRHMIISLHILDSAWDSLLEWPMKLNVTVIIRGQNNSFNGQSKDFIKSFRNTTVHKENESTRYLQMFIPHRSLKENNYICNNTLILEAFVKVTDNCRD